MLPDEKRAQTNAKQAVALVVGLTVFALIAAFVLPIGVDAVNDPINESYNSSTSETIQVNAQLNSTVTATTSGTDATIELATNSTTTSKTINVGDNATYSFTEGDVDVRVTEAGSDYAVYYVEYEKDFGFGDGASALWDNLGLILVLAAFLFVVGMALDAKRRV